MYFLVCLANNNYSSIILESNQIFVLCRFFIFRPNPFFEASFNKVRVGRPEKLRNVFAHIKAMSGGDPGVLPSVHPAGWLPTCPVVAEAQLNVAGLFPEGLPKVCRLRQVLEGSFAAVSKPF